MSHLVSEGPGRPHALLDVSDQTVAGLEARVVVEGGPDLTANLLKHREERSIFGIPASHRET